MRGSRVKAQAAGGTSIMLEWDDRFSPSRNHELAAIALCKKLGWKGRFHSGPLRDCSQVWVFDNGSEALEVM